MKKLALISTLSLSLFAQNITLKEGWNLLGAVEDLNINSTNKCIEKLFTYEDNVWSNLGNIKKAKGFWAYSQNGCSFDTDNSTNTESRGLLVNSELITTVNKTEINFYMMLLGVDTSAKYDVEIYKVVYKTINQNLELEDLTGVIAIPKEVDNLPILSYQHGTIHTKAKAPSMISDDTKFLSGILSTNGFVTIMSDYLGYNTQENFNNKLHPYHLKAPTVSATLDLLRATKELLNQKNITFNNQLFLGGYSEGGYATMALDSELSTNDEFSVTASAPMAGAYDLSYTADYMMNLEESHPNPAYFPFIVLAYNNYYKLTDEPQSFFVDDYKSVIDTFDNLESYTWKSLNETLNSNIKDMFDLSDTEGSYKSYQSKFSELFKQNSVYKYSPEGKVKLYHCKGDKDVPYQNSVIAYEYLKNKGDVELIEVENSENLNHETCATPSLIDAINWFIELKK